MGRAACYPGERVMRVVLASEAAPGRPKNEDGALRIGDVVGVFDGVTAPSISTGCSHGPAWYVERLIARLGEFVTETPEGELQELLAKAIAGVRGDHEGRCDLDNPATPAATVCLTRSDGDRLEYLILADCTLIVDQGYGTTAVLTDGRFINAVAEIRRAALAAGGVRQSAGTPTVGKYELVNKPHGYWIAAANPQAAYQAVTGELRGVRRAALLTDGVSCAVDQYHLMTWDGLLDFLTEAGPHALISRVRQAESDDPTATKYPRYKRHDDATAALCIIEEP